MHRNALSLIAASALALVCSTGQGAEPVSTQAAIARQGELLSLDRLRSVQIGEQVVLSGLPLSTTESVTVELERFTNLASGAKLIVVGEDGIERPLPDLGLSLFHGQVAGEPDSHVFVSVSPHGTNGFITRDGKMLSISTGPYAQRAEMNLPVRIIDPGTLPMNQDHPSGCGTALDSARIMELAPNGFAPEPKGKTQSPAAGECHTADIAVETDWEYTNRHFSGNTTASAAYAQTLIAAISEIYERDFDTALRVSFIRVWAANNDPYTTGGDPLNEVLGHWRTNMSGEDRTIVHYLTGQNNTSYGGVAYLSALCSNNWGYGVSNYLSGSFPYPLQDNAFGNWDVVVAAHEMGHNFGTGHTHDYSPQIDNCANSCSGNTSSTIMSYCHTCSGGISNIRLGFHPRVITTVTNYIASIPGCLPAQSGGNADAVDDTGLTFENTAVEIDVLSNDLTGDCGGFPSISSHDSTSAQGGSVAIAFNAALGRDTLTYTPAAGFDGSDSFGYTVDSTDSATVAIEVQAFRDPENPVNTVSGVEASYYDFAGAISAMPDVSALTPTSTELVADVNLTSTSGAWGGTGLFDTFVAIYEGYVSVPFPALYTFYTESDDGSNLYIGTQLVVDNDGLHGMQEASGQIALNPGKHAIRIEFFENAGAAGLIASMQSSALGKMVIPASFLFSADDCQADLTGDGVVDSGDLSSFISLFLAGDLAVDLTGDGVVDSGDLSLFISLFLAGC